MWYYQHIVYYIHFMNQIHTIQGITGRDVILFAGLAIK